MLTSHRITFNNEELEIEVIDESYKDVQVIIDKLGTGAMEISPMRDYIYIYDYDRDEPYPVAHIITVN